MIANLKPYSSMRDPRVPWLGEVPKHWEVRRLRNLVDMRVSNVDKHTREGEQPVRLCNYVDVYKHDYIRPSTGLMRATATRDEVDQFRLAVGDVLITKDSEAWNDIGVPALVQETAPDLVSGYHLALLRPFEQRLSGEYLLRVLQSTAAQYQFHVEANGVTRYGLSHAAIKSVWLPAPPLPEQAAIVRFLDHADRRIRRYIRAKQKLIKLLEDQKQAIIHRAVTRGLDPNVRLKPSGVEWLGDVPEHWEVRQLRHMGRLHKGVGGSKEDATSDGVPCVRYGELYFHYHNVIRQPRGFVSAERAAAYTPIRFGDVLFAASGERVEEIGKSAVNLYARHAVCGGDVVIFRPTVEVHAPFLGYSLDSYSAALQKATMCRGTTIKHIYPDELRGLWFCVPPLSEQERIATTLDSELFDCDTAAARLEREIDLLREYRTRLIADVVTGKLDVREAAARLPDEVEQAEPLDEIATEGEAVEDGADDTDEVPAEAEA